MEVLSSKAIEDLCHLKYSGMLFYHVPLIVNMCVYVHMHIISSGLSSHLMYVYSNNIMYQLNLHLFRVQNLKAVWL